MGGNVVGSQLYAMSIPHISNVGPSSCAIRILVGHLDTWIMQRCVIYFILFLLNLLHRQNVL